MKVAPPGTILQRLYIRERLRRLAPGRFVEIGVGGGELSHELLRLGWHGEGWDLSSEAVVRATATNAAAVESGRYEVHLGDWVAAATGQPADLVVSSMVIEHLPTEQERRYVERAHATLTERGRVVLLVPASPDHWGIEDDIAGHERRYTRRLLVALLEAADFDVDHVAGLTFPVSNALLPLSNFLVRRAEAHKRALTPLERTKQSGTRSVQFKTTFPPVAGLVLNDWAMYPFHLVQKATRDSARALVLYAEAVRRPRSASVTT